MYVKEIEEMTLININSALKKKEIIAALEADTEVQFKYVKDLSKMEWQMEAIDPDGTHGNLVSYVKKVVKKQPWGGALYYRVLEDGQAFSGQKI